MSTQPAPQPGYDVFLSYNRADSYLVRAIQRQLEAGGVRTFRDADRLRPGFLWPEAIEHALGSSAAVAVFLGPAGLGPWQKREMYFALDRQVEQERGGLSFPVIPVLLEGGEPEVALLFLNTWIDLRDGLGQPGSMDGLRDAIRTGQKRTPGESIAICPYRDLRAFQEEDAPFYFGRESFVADLMQKIRPRTFVALVGPSGGGKSSVVLSGILPSLKRRRPPQLTWEAVSFTPGGHPWRNLADALIPLLQPKLPESKRGKAAGHLVDDLERGKGALPSTITRALKVSRGTDQLLLVVDQFEELFTLTPQGIRRQFVDDLLNATETSPVTVLITLRADYYSAAIELSRDLSKALQTGQVNLGPMLRQEIEASIEGPAKVVGLPIEQGLARRITDDAIGHPGNLPLLEYALTELWKLSKGTLTHKAYDASGGVSGAIAKRAETVMSGLKAGQHDTVRRLFTRLVRVSPDGEEGADTRTRARRDEIGEGAWSVALEFAKADVRLLVVSRDAQDDMATVEVAHEALIRNWGRLQEWLRQDRDFLLWRQRLKFQISEWNRKQRSEAALLRGPLLEEAMGWLASRAADLSDEERTFIEWTLKDDYQIAMACSSAEELLPQAETAAVAEWLTARYLSGTAEALGIARRYDVLNTVLSGIAVELTRSGKLECAMEVARRFEPPASGIAVVAGIIRAAAEAGQSELACQLSEEAFTAAAAAGNDPDDQPHQGRAAVVTALAEGELPEFAVSLVSRLETEADQQAVFSRAVHLLSAGSAWEPAQELIAAVHDQGMRDELHGNLCYPLSGSGRMLDAAREAGQISQADVRESRLLWLAEQRNQEADTAFTIAGQIEDPEKGTRAWAAVASNLAGAGDIERAEVACRKAIGHARSISSDYTRQDILARMITSFREADEGSKALELSREIEPVEDRLIVLGGLLRIAACEDDKPGIMEVADDGLRLASAIGSEYFRAGAIAKMLKVLPVSRSGLAIQIAATIDDPELRAAVFHHHVEALRNSGHTRAAFEVALNIADEDLRRGVLNELVRKVYEGPRPSRALGLADLIPNESDRAHILASLLEKSRTEPDEDGDATLRQRMANFIQADDLSGVEDAIAGAESRLLQFEMLMSTFEASHAAGKPLAADGYLERAVELISADPGAWEILQLLVPLAKAGISAKGMEIVRRHGSGVGSWPIHEALRRLHAADHTAALANLANEALEYFENQPDEYSRRGGLTGLVEAVYSSGQSELALGLARRIVKPEGQAWALAKWMELEARAGNGNSAAAIAPEAMRAAGRIIDQFDRHPARCAIVSPLAYTGQTELIVSLAGSIDNDVERKSLLDAAGAALGAASYMKEAFQFVASVVEDAWNHPVRAGIVESVWKEEGEKATLERIDEIEGEADRELALNALGRILAGAGAAKSALRAASQIRDEYQRRRAFAAILQSAGGTFPSIRDASVPIANRQQRSEALGAVCEELAGQGKTALARKLAEFIDVPGLQAAALGPIAEALNKSGRPEAAAGTARPAIPMAQEIREEYKRRPLLSGLVKSFAGVGKLDVALELAADIGDAADRAAALLAAAQDMLAAKRTGDAGRFVQEAAAAARQIKPPEDTTEVLAAIGSTLVETGELEAAIEFAPGIVDPFSRLDALVKVATNLPAGQDAKARDLGAQVTGALSGVTDINQRARLNGALAAVWARLREYKQARETAERCFLPSEKLRAFTAIVRASAGLS